MTDRPDPNEMTEAELRDEVRRLRGELKASKSGVSRRTFVRGSVGVAGLAALLFASDPVAADPQGVYPVESEDPFKKIRADRIRFVPRSSDPSDVDDGEMWYRGDL